MKRLNAHASDASTADMNVRDASENIKFGNGQTDNIEALVGESLDAKKKDVDELVFPIEATSTNKRIAAD